MVLARLGVVAFSLLLDKEVLQLPVGLSPDIGMVDCIIVGMAAG